MFEMESKEQYTKRLVGSFKSGDGQRQVKETQDVQLAD